MRVATATLTGGSLIAVALIYAVDCWRSLKPGAAPIPPGALCAAAGCPKICFGVPSSGPPRSHRRGEGARLRDDPIRWVTMLPEVSALFAQPRSLRRD